MENYFHCTFAGLEEFSPSSPPSFCGEERGLLTQVASRETKHLGQGGGWAPVPPPPEIWPPRCKELIPRATLQKQPSGRSLGARPAPSSLAPGAESSASPPSYWAGTFRLSLDRRSQPCQGEGEKRRKSSPEVWITQRDTQKKMKRSPRARL